LSSEVTRDIASGIRIALTPEQRARLGRTREVNPEAYETYLKARYLMNQFTPASRAKARELFQRAIDLDPTFASAYAGLATVQGIANLLGGGPPRANSARVLAAARRALELDPNQGEAHAILGVHHLYAEWDWNAAETELRRALDLNPGNAFVYHPYGDYLLVTGRLEESLDYVRRGKDIDPLSPLIVLPVAGHLSFLGRYDEAIQECQKFLEIQPNSPWPRSFMENALWYKGEEERSFQMMRAETEDKNLLALLDRGHATGGPRGAMWALADSLVAQSKSRYVSPLSIAGTYADARQTEQAFQWLEKAYEERVPFLLHLRADPTFVSLRSDPRFADLVRRIGFPQ
jgi:tetratricopeptide (TPR) repeat protein